MKTKIVNSRSQEKLNSFTKLLKISRAESLISGSILIFDCLCTYNFTKKGQVLKNISWIRSNVIIQMRIQKDFCLILEQICAQKEKKMLLKSYLLYQFFQTIIANFCFNFFNYIISFLPFLNVNCFDKVHKR